MDTGFRNNLLWLLIVAYLGWVLTDSFFHPFPKGVAAAINVFFMVTIAAIHALRRYSLKQFAIFFVIAFIVSNFYENVSILTGFPFGNYHYTELLGPKLFLVPVIIAPAYFGAGYLAWSVGHVLTGHWGTKLDGGGVFRVPLVAAFVMVMWDLVMDPIAATIQRHWIWHDGGSYFGVPFVNYMGWLLCVYTIYQIFALYISRQKAIPGGRGDADATDAQYWCQPGVALAITSLSWILYALTGTNSVVTDAAGRQWQTMHIYQTSALIGIFTLWFVAIVAFFQATSFTARR